MSLKIILNGSDGRMGKAVQECAKDYDIGIQKLNRTTLPSSVFPTDAKVILDFSTPKATMALIPFALQYKIPMVIGVTGYSCEELNQIEEASRHISIVLSSNFSVGMNLLFSLTEQIAKNLPSYFTPSIVENHHITKKDAPSGTALSLAKIIQKCKKNLVRLHCTSDSMPSFTAQDALAVHSIREGQNNGEHTVRLDHFQLESLCISHKAYDKKIFAKGALEASLWVYTLQKKAGLYSMQDVLGL